MRVAFYDPSEAAVAPSPFGGRDPADLVASALTACGHDVAGVYVPSLDEPGPQPAAARVAVLVDRLRSPQHPSPPSAPLRPAPAGIRARIRPTWKTYHDFWS